MLCLQGMLYWEMMKLLVLLLVFSGMTCSEGEKGPLEVGSNCERYEETKRNVAEGEALCVVHDSLHSHPWNDSKFDLFTWQRQLGDTYFYFSSSEEERIHHHGHALLFLPLSINDSGLYIGLFNYSMKCYIFPLRIHVASASVPVGMRQLYTPIESSEIFCPDQVRFLCDDLKGKLSWYKNSSLMVGEELPNLRLTKATKADNGMYTCLCTWRHNGRTYNSTASRMLEIPDPNARHEIQITYPTTAEMIVHTGYPLKIKCEALFGTNIETGGEVWWEKNNHSLSGMEGYEQKFSSYMVEHSKKSFFSSTLIINKVQQSDLHTSFKCLASNKVETKYHILSLKPAETLTNLVVRFICVSILFLLAATAIKYFAVDLVLFYRRFLRFTKACNDGSRYDVYVVYHSEKESKAMEEVLNKFLSQALPLVLEQKCGYRVFIHGRDDIPGEDRLEHVEERVTQSRRLMVVLTPGSEVKEMLGSCPSSPAGMDVDWQVALYQASVQEIRVILVQLGEVGPQGYTHLSTTLQHLVHKCAPLRWREDSPGAAHWNSRFWKRVRYAMPAAPAKPSSSFVV